MEKKLRKCKFFKCKKRAKKDKEYCSPNCRRVDCWRDKKCHRCGKLCGGYLCQKCHSTPKGVRVNAMRKHYGS